MNLVDIQMELRQVQTDFDQLVAGATPQDLHRLSGGTRGTNRQLLWHMVFGYLIKRTLMPLAHLLGRLGWSRFAAILNALHRPFHLINFVGSAGGGLLLRPRRMAATINALDCRLAAETPASLALTMHFPTR